MESGPLIAQLYRPVDLPDVHAINWGKAIMLCHCVRAGQMDVVPHHVKGCVPEDLLKAEHVSSIHNVVDGKGMPQEVGVKTFDARSPCQSIHYPPQGVVGHRIAVQSRNEVADPLVNRFGPEVVEVLQERLLRRTTERQHTFLLSLAHHLHIALFQIDVLGP